MAFIGNDDCTRVRAEQAVLVVDLDLARFALQCRVRRSPDTLPRIANLALFR
jgi:hypothetical protein